MLRHALRGSGVVACVVGCSHGRVSSSCYNNSMAARAPLQLTRRAYGMSSTASTATAAAAVAAVSSSSSSATATVTPSPSTAAAAAAAARVMAAAACPYHRSATATVDVATATPLAPRCPVIGTALPLSCPVEAHATPTAATATALRTPPTLTRMALVLGKSQLSAYVAATATAGYVLGGGTSVIVAAVVTLGTLLQSFSANTANQIIEAPYDALMKRTCRRPLPMRHMTPRAAAVLCAGEMAVGTAVLYCVSPAAAGLGVVNWLLYVAMYTPLKRVSALNTWFGSIVGGVPPLMGGVAATGGLLTGPVVLLGSLLFVWQIPHFNGLAFHCRRDYEAAGYRMLAFYNPWRASFYAVALSLVAAVITLLGPALVGMPVEGAWYYPVALLANTLMVYKAVLFHRAPQLHCRGCFVSSYVYLSIMLVAVMLNHLQPLHQMDRAVTFVLQWLRGDGGGGAAADTRTQQEQQEQQHAAGCSGSDGDVATTSVALLPVQ